MATKDSTTLREFINSLERLSENGKYDNIRVVTMNYDDECSDIGWYGVDDVYPIEELEECNPQNGEKCLVIQM